ncbi:MAG: NTPase [Planctomycetota bacterium]|nr:MAG: NTPase [Planctomycetota bacterium]
MSSKDYTNIRNILITGSPGVGKTTVIMRLVEYLSDRKVAGFYTEEIRRGGQRLGFRVETFAGESAVLAHVDIKSQQRVSRYGVDVAAFEKLILLELSRPCDIIIIDEIGKMECFSHPFITAVLQLLDKSIPVVATIAVKGGGFISEVKDRDDVEIWQVNKVNRDELPRQLAQAVSLLAGQ